jgi:hypothetical protein
VKRLELVYLRFLILFMITLLCGCVGFSIHPEKKIVMSDDHYPLISYELKFDKHIISSTPKYKGFLFYIQGSEYNSVLRNLHRLAGMTAAGFRVVVLEKRGVYSETDVNLTEAHQFSDKEFRVKDELTVINEYLRDISLAERQNVLLIGGSEGGDVASVVAEREKRITQLILLGSGGGWSQ